MLKIRLVESPEAVDDVEVPDPDARALATKPVLVVCDEPTAVLSVLSVLEAFLLDPSASVQALHDDLARLDSPGWTVASALDELPTRKAVEALCECDDPDAVAWLRRHPVNDER